MVELVSLFVPLGSVHSCCPFTVCSDFERFVHCFEMDLCSSLPLFYFFFNGFVALFGNGVVYKHSVI